MPIPEERRKWKRQVLQLFEYEASYYANERERFPGFTAQLRHVLEMLKNERGLLLDIGCAAGAEMTALEACGFRVVGIDYSQDMLRGAKRRFSHDPRALLCRAEAESLPFRTCSFDHAVCLGVFEYLPNYTPAVSEVARVLRPGGLAVFSIPMLTSLDYFSERLPNVTVAPIWRGVKRLLGRRTPGSVPSHNRNPCIPWRFRSLLRRYGLEPEVNAYCWLLVHPLGRFFPALADQLAVYWERFSTVRGLGWTFSQYLVSARKRNHRSNADTA